MADVGRAGLADLKKMPDGLGPTQEVVSFNQAHNWSPASAPHRLAPIFRESWFALAVTPKLKFQPLPYEEVIKEIGMVAAAGPSYRGQIETLLEFLIASAIVERDNGHVRLLPRGTNRADTESDSEMPTTTTTTPPLDAYPVRQMPMSNSFVKDAAGVVQFNISVKVDMTEFAGWDPTRITAFFSGIAQVLAAKGNVEKQAAGS